MSTSKDDGAAPLSELAAEPAEDSVATEESVVSDGVDPSDTGTTDTGTTVPEDGAQ